MQFIDRQHITSSYINKLRARLKDTRPPPDPTIIGYGGAYRDLPPEFESAGTGEPRIAAVLVPLVRREPVPTVLLTRRTEHLPDHPGQVSFPGGSAEPEDADAVATALRESNEELGIPAERIEPIGFLAPYRTITDFVITPVVGLVEPGPLRPDPHEVAAAFEVPLDYLLCASTFERREKDLNGHRVAYYVVNYEGEVIWGATAAILQKFCGLLA
ncbi:MAG TPA: CoA pyrophosphatase [Gammaproteobacteria bacterium]|nr:CoA pyrophosphatase [Gammaproteobacteria bacterium]